MSPAILPTAASLFERLPRTLRRHRLMTTWMRFTGENPLQLVRIRDDSFGFADLSNGFFRLIVIEQDFEADFFRVADAFLSDGGTFFDVGANHGLLSFGLAGRHGSAIDFHLFEPNEDLLKSIALTSALYPEMKLSVVAAALTDHEGSVGFCVDHIQSGMSHLDEHGEVQVRATTVDRYLDEAGVRQVDLMKIDIEGYELLALRGAEQSLRTRRVEAIYFEYCEKWLTRVGPPSEVLDFLQAVGFAVCLANPQDYGPAGGPTHTLALGQAAHGVPLRVLQNEAPPVSTNLLALPLENLVSLDGRPN